MSKAKVKYYRVAEGAVRLGWRCPWRGQGSPKATGSRMGMGWQDGKAAERRPLPRQGQGRVPQKTQENRKENAHPSPGKPEPERPRAP